MLKEQEDVQSIRLKLNLTQEQLAKKLNISKQFICSVEKGIKKLSANKREILMDIYYASYPNLKENFVKVAILDGDNFNINKNTAFASLSMNLINKNDENAVYGIFCIETDAMEGAIPCNAKVIFKYEKALKVVDNNIYVFYYKNELFIRRIARNLKELIISADNPKYQKIILAEEEIKNIKLIGRIVGILYQ